jgi:hypothetical protein
MVMSSGVRKFALSAHLTCSIGWIGAVVAYIALGVVAVRAQDTEAIRASWIAMSVTGSYVIVPLALASFVTGLVMALGTKWGLFRHYWVIFSLFLTLFSVVVLLEHMPGINAVAAMAKDADPTVLSGLGGDLGHPSIGLGILLVVQFLNLYKPRGMTRYGQRKQERERTVLREGVDSRQP